MNPYGSERKGSADDVTVQKDLIKGVANWRWRLNQKEYECNGSLD